jgi:hypothetical protein
LTPSVNVIAVESGSKSERGRGVEHHAKFSGDVEYEGAKKKEKEEKTKDRLVHPQGRKSR